NELNNEGFEIERLNSNNGKFESIGWKTGNGSTERLSTYKFTDYNDFKGVSYYRLKQIDFDGQFDYSNVVVIENRGEENPLMIFPNPVKNELNIRNGEGLATIYNLLGQPVKQLSIDNQQLTLNVSDLTEGQYVLHIQKENGTVITKRFVK
ncbi:MAG: T9SS type A sorting domain-containing protein, partial [Saprospiraceae bacterium]